MQTSGINIPTKLPGIEQSIFSIMTALANKHNAINLAQGFPDFNCPPQLIELVTKYMKDGKNQYAPMPGHLPLKEKIAAKAEKLYGAKYNPDTEITITAGATQAIHLIISAIVKEKDEVIIFEPAYDSYIPAILLNRGAPKHFNLEPPNYAINWEQVKKMVTSKTRLIIINTPHNPSGSVFSEEDMVQLQKIIANRDIFVLSDEVYEHIIFDGIKHQSVCSYPELARKSFAVFSFGKTYHTTGWKMGYVLAPKLMTDELRKVFSYAMFSANTPMQWAYTEIMDDEQHYLDLSSFYQQKRDLFLDAIKGSKFKPIPCKGAYFQCLDYSEISKEGDRKLAERLTKEIGVASIPTSVFYHDKQDYKVLRFCFAKSPETLKAAGEKLCKI
ncbi:MAG: methionine aminotransferase [Bacteroidetes bacterium]|nr:methionine aminotransferase [Bacteroidota bacterium]